MKKALPLILRAFLVLAFLLPAGCDQALPGVTGTTAPTAPAASPASATAGSPAATATQPAPVAATTPTPTLISRITTSADSLRGLTIEFWHPWSGAASGAVQALINEFNQKNPYGILVQPVGFKTQDALSSELAVARALTDLPDLSVAALYEIQAWKDPLKPVDLAPFVNDPTWGFSATARADYYPAFWEAGVVGGRRLGVPAQRSAQVLLFNQSWANELGYHSPPATRAEFQQQACAAARARQLDQPPGSLQTGGWIISTNYAAMLSWLYAGGSQVIEPPANDTPQGAYQLNTPEVKDTFAFLRTLYDKNCAWLSEAPLPAGEFATREGLFATGSLVDLDLTTRAFQQANSQDAWTAIPFPAAQGQPALAVYGTDYTVLAGLPQRQLAAWVLVKWLLEPDHQARLVQATGTFPLRAAALKPLQAYAQAHPQWADAVAALKYARPEPGLASWNQVRWALGDAGIQLFRYYFTLQQVPDLASLLDQTAADLNTGTFLREVTAIPSPTNTPSGSETPTRTLRPTATNTLTPTPPPTKASTPIPKPASATP